MQNMKETVLTHNKLAQTEIFSEDDNIMLEDESGRIRLVGERVTKTTLVTGEIGRAHV